ncbi:MAG: glycosyltransferase family 39 protein, partial [Chitinophagaceae bacterium]|nr:glycosyltransferase family 39 protein [Chitinophagaceae bacterium]
MFSKTTIWAALLLVVYLLNGIFLIPQSSLTYDEMDHWSYGKRILKIQPQRVYPFDDASTMPISGLNAIPRAIEQLADPSLQKSDAGFSDILHGRYVTLLLCLLTGILIWQWSRELFGEWAGLASLFLYVFCPNLNAHGTLLTTDAYAALFSLATFYSLWRFIQVSNWKRFFLFAICLSISQVVKPSLLHLLLLSGVVCFVVILYRGQWKKNWKKQLLRVGIISLLILVIINLAFFFQGTGQPLDGYAFQSQTFKNLQAGIGSSIGLPFPVPFIEGIDLTMFMNQLGAGHPEVSGPNYLLGVTRTGNGFWYYYFISFIFKTPLSVLLL